MQDAPREPTPAARQADPPANEDESPPPGDDWWNHCPLCGTRLRNQGCKYRCPRCRYFMSCSDFD